MFQFPTRRNTTFTNNIAHDEHSPRCSRLQHKHTIPPVSHWECERVCCCDVRMSRVVHARFQCWRLFSFRVEAQAELRQCCHQMHSLRREECTRQIQTWNARSANAPLLHTIWDTWCSRVQRCSLNKLCCLMLADILHYASVYCEHTLEKGVERRNARIDASLIATSLYLSVSLSLTQTARTGSFFLIFFRTCWTRASWQVPSLKSLYALKISHMPMTGCQDNDCNLVYTASLALIEFMADELSALWVRQIHAFYEHVCEWEMFRKYSCSSRVSAHENSARNFSTRLALVNLWWALLTPTVHVSTPHSVVGIF